MNKRWLALLHDKELCCHLCGLLILSRRQLTADHSPIPRSKGGKEVLPAHRWCDEAQADKGFLRASDLERLVKAWKKHHVKFPVEVYDSIAALKEKER
nr:MAG TPA: hypothetical protein [Caudoviricetes sp.]